MPQQPHKQIILNTLITFFYLLIFNNIILYLYFSKKVHTTRTKSIVKGDYFGQLKPQKTALLLAPGFISTGMNERDFVISPDGNEAFFTREVGNYRYTTIFYTHKKNNIWSIPEVFEYCRNSNFKYVEPHLSYDGHKLYFISNMPIDSSKEGNEDIWVCTKLNNVWNPPQNIGSPVNTLSKEYYPSTTMDGTIYYTHLDVSDNKEYIYRSKFLNGSYQKPEKLGKNVNIGLARYNACISFDESLIIIPAFGMTDSYGETDYYISFRDSLDHWSLPINMGVEVNSKYQKEWSASISNDGKFIFFMSDRPGIQEIDGFSQSSLTHFYNSPQNGNSDIYWISTSIIDDLKKKSIFN